MQNKLKIVHTSDWHLGLITKDINRLDEQKFFLDWLCNFIETEKIDILLIAGDIFDQSQPSAEAQRLYYDFLNKVNKQILKKIVIIGGNHDSSARLDAPKELLNSLNIHIVGGLKTIERDLDKCLCPVFDENNNVITVIIAFPFVHEYHLGIKTAGESPEIIYKNLTEKLTTCYNDLYNKAKELYSNVPIIAMGHLACGKGIISEQELQEDSSKDVHLIGSISLLKDNIFNSNFAYVALGHIHKYIPINKLKNIYYSGTPYPIDIGEANFTQKINIIEIENANISVISKEVPLLKLMKKIRGEHKQILKELKQLEKNIKYLLGIEILSTELITDNQSEIIEYIEQQNNIDILFINKILQKTDMKENSNFFIENNLVDLKEIDVFKELCLLTYGNFPKELEIAFNSILNKLE